MALHPDFPRSPYATLPPNLRWFPAAEELRSTAYEKLLPPLVAKVREEVKAWRDVGLRWRVAYFPCAAHLVVRDRTPDRAGGRHAIAISLLLRPARSSRDGDLACMTCAARATNSTCCASMPPGAVSANMFDEDWPRFVVKMATGAGKTKVLSLLMAWSYLPQALRGRFDRWRATSC